MNQEYTDCVEQVSSILFNAIIEREKNLTEKIPQLDRDLFSLLRRIGLRVMSMLLSCLINQVTNKEKKPDFIIQRRPKIKYTVLFGKLKIESPYLWNKKLKKGVRPVAEKLGITHGDYSRGIKRALAEFGAEESFVQAAKRFQEHYGFWVESSSVRREVENIAQLAQGYVEEKLTEARGKSNKELNQKTERILLELDGCQIRTGVKISSQKVGLTKVRKLKKSCRQVDWREVRVGFARPVDQKEQRTFVAYLGKYPEIVQQLVGAAYAQGLFVQSQVYAIADGAVGLKEALESQFPKLQFILDRPHLKQHLYQGVDAMELKGKIRKICVSSLLDLINFGQVEKIIKKLKNYRGKGEKRVQTLADYLERFQSSVHYNKFRALGLPIGSGEVESAHRYIPQKRLKIPGATWHPDTINPMLALRVIRANNWWSNFWSHLIKKNLA